MLVLVTCAFGNLDCVLWAASQITASLPFLHRKRSEKNMAGAYRWRSRERRVARRKNEREREREQTALPGCSAYTLACRGDLGVR